MAKKKTPQAKRAVAFRLNPSLIERAEKFADKHKRPMTTVMEDALAEYLDRYEHLPSLEESAE